MKYYLKDSVVTTLPEYIEYTSVSGGPSKEGDSPIIESVVRKLSTDCDYIEISLAGYNYIGEIEGETDFLSVIIKNGKLVLVESEASKLRTEKWEQIRQIRDLRLKSFDGYIQKYIDANEDIPQDLIDCRTLLRDIPQTYQTGEINDWENVVWPDYVEEEN